jgi:LemA protein
MFLVFLVLVALVGVWLVSAYNGLVSMRQRYGQAFSDIDVQLKQRHDLIPNLVETVKGYAAHEKDTLEEVTRARNLAVSAQGPAAQSAAEAQLSGALGRLIAISESYPDLKANANFQQLQSELADIENKIAAARRFFNNTAAEYNAACQGFPGVLIAQRFNFKPVDFFNLEEGERKAVQETPQVKFYQSNQPMEPARGSLSPRAGRGSKNAAISGAAWRRDRLRCSRRMGFIRIFKRTGCVRPFCSPALSCC